MNNQVQCPKCNSDQITANKKGFSGRKAVAGAVLTGGVGLLAGTIGSNKVVITCLACGHNFNPGAKSEPASTKPEYKATPLEILFVPWIFTATLIFISYSLYGNEYNFFGTIFLIAGLIFLLLAVFGTYTYYQDKPKNN